MSKQWRILVVEDDPDGRELVSAILAHLKFVVDVANDAEQAEELLFARPNSYDVVVIDLMLPGKDGWDLLNAINAHPQTTRLTCVAMTAYHSSKIREQALAAGFKAYFSKPIDAVAFSRALESIA
jgi:CheY-like chemotaxis protein